MFNLFRSKKNLKEMQDVVENYLFSEFIYNDAQELLMQELKLDHDDDKDLIEIIILSYHAYSYFLIQTMIAGIKDKKSQMELLDFLYEKFQNFNSITRHFLLKNELKVINVGVTNLKYFMHVLNFLKQNIGRPDPKKSSAEHFAHLITIQISGEIEARNNIKLNHSHKEKIFNIGSLINSTILPSASAAMLNINNQ